MVYLGIGAGVLVLFQVTQVPIVQGYWLLALAYLLSGRWPTGVPPAWRTGRVEAWPAGGGMRGRRMGGPSAGIGRAKPAATPAPEAVAAPASAANSRSRSTTSKRKRKRRS
jgi:hypothetical protein